MVGLLSPAGQAESKAFPTREVVYKFAGSRCQLALSVQGVGRGAYQLAQGSRTKPFPPVETAKVVVAPTANWVEPRCTLG